MAESKTSSHKKEIRRLIRKREQELSPETKRQSDRLLGKRLLAEILRQQGDCKEPVYCYVSCKNEADTRWLLQRLWEKGVRTAVPRVKGEQMEFFEITGFSDLEPGYFGIPEPREGCRKVCCPESVILVPGAAFSRDGKRLGRGGGFYDRFLEREPKHKKIAAAYEYQLMETLPSEAHDVPVDMVVTEKQCCICRTGEE